MNDRTPHPSHALLLHTLEQAVAWLDLDGRMCIANPALATLLGDRAGTLAGRAWRGLVAADSLARWDAAFDRACRGEAGSCACSVKGLDGRSLAVEASLLHVTGASGGIEGVALSVSHPLRRRGDDDMLRWIARATAPLTGGDFFATLMHHLAEAIGLRRGFIGECMGNRKAKGKCHGCAQGRRGLHFGSSRNPNLFHVGAATLLRKKARNPVASGPAVAVAAAG